MFIISQAKEDIFQVYLDKWQFTAFPKTQIWTIILFPIKVDNISTNVVFDIDISKIKPQAALSIDEETEGLAIKKIGWLSKLDK